MAQSIGKVNSNGTLNDGSFYSIQDVDVLMDGVNGDINDIEDDIDDIEGDITTIGGNITTINGNITSLTGRVAALEQSGSGVTVLETTVTQSAVTINGYTGAQLLAAINSGNMFCIKVVMTDDDVTMTMFYNILYAFGTTGSIHQFVCATLSSGSLTKYIFTSSDGTTNPAHSL